MKMLDIVKHGDKQVKNLSGGTKRKLAYAITLFGNQEITLLDGNSLFFVDNIFQILFSNFKNHQLDSTQNQRENFGTNFV